MKPTLTQLLLLVLSFLLFACSAPEKEAEKDLLADLVFEADNAGLTLPEGFQALAVTDTTGYGRHLAVNDNGDIYMSLRRRTDYGGIVALRDTTGDGKADIQEYFGDYQGTGLEIYKNYLYFSSDTSIHRYKLTPGELIPQGEPEMIVSGFPVERQHAVKPFAFDNVGNIYVNVGAPSNACQEQDRTKGSPGQDPCPILENYAGIWRFDAERPGQTKEADGYRFATGIRNAVALNWNPNANKLYALQHGRDMLHNWYPETYTEEVPAEEFFLVEDGDDFGWPYCFYNQLIGKKVLNPEYGGNGELEERCAEKKGPIMAFPGHYAPNDIMFYTASNFPEKYQNGALIAFHGSWNREAENKQQGYNIVFVPFDEEMPSGDWEVFADGFEGPEDVESPNMAIQRPTGVALGPDGSVYVSDSRKGKIYRIVYTGS
jgi:glucose/arabinose dehydrogenase